MVKFIRNLNDVLQFYLYHEFWKTILWVTFGCGKIKDDYWKHFSQLSDQILKIPLGFLKELQYLFAMHFKVQFSYISIRSIQ